MEPLNSSVDPGPSHPWSKPSMEFGAPFDRHTYKVLITTIQGFLLGSFAILGIVSNFVNLFIFHRQGIMADSSTVTLAALAVSDFISSVLNLWGSVLTLIINLMEESEQWSWDVESFIKYTSGRPRLVFIQVTCWVTAYLAFERFFGVMFPFKVKSVFSPKRSCIVLICINVGTIILYIPNSVSHIPKWIERNNRSVVSFELSFIFPYLMKNVHVFTNALTLRCIAVVAVVMCNIAIFWKVYLSQRFRKSAARAGQSKSDCHTSKVKDSDSTKATKEKNLLRMIMIISLLFVVCYIPDVCLVVLDVAGGQNYRPHEYEKNIAFGFCNFMEAISCSCNLFIYYNLSSRFRADFRAIFFKRK